MSDKMMRKALVAAYIAGNQHGHNSTVEGYWSEAEDVAEEYADEALAQQPAAVVKLTDDIQVGVDIGANSESVFVVVMRKEGEANKIIYSSSHIIAKQSIARTDLTDDEIIDAFGGFRFNIPIDRIRAVIAAFIAKQGVGK